MNGPYREPRCKRKLSAPSDPAGYKHLQCQFYLEKKRRLCAMQRKKEYRYCTQHMVHDPDSKHEFESVPCPLDPKHNVLTKDLEGHLLKCNARPAQSHPVWFQQDINSGEVQECIKSDAVNEDELINALLDQLSAQNFSSLPVSIKEHPGLNARMNQVGTKKHATQQSSLIGNIKEHNLLSPECFYMELGCGKAELSRFVNICISHDLGDLSLENSCHYGYGFIDRGVNRMKSDNKIINEAGRLSPTVKRDRIDLKDLVLDKFLQDTNYKKVVAISKHLCGVATDLTLKMLLQLHLTSSNKHNFGGMFIAMCCRHACSWDLLLPESRSFLAAHGFENKQSFEILKKVASWAVSRIDDNSVTQSADDESVSKEIDGSGVLSGKLDARNRDELGFKARRLLDESRIFALQQRLPTYKVEMFLYADLETTLENVCLMVKP